LLAGGCASSSAKRYSGTPYSSINSWSLKLNYEASNTSEITRNGEVVQTQKTRSGNSTNGNSRFELNFREELFYYLKDGNRININENGEGLILISIDDEVLTTMLRGVTVKFTEKNGEVISRMKIKNSDFTSEKFLRLVGDSICSEINSDK